MEPSAPILLQGGRVFDGAAVPDPRDPRAGGVVADLLLEGGLVRAIDATIAPPPGARVVDVGGCWVMPGFIDLHTHYDAEIEVAPALSESVRHGVTTVVLGSCGLSMAVGRPVDLADMFCRVEGIPRATVLPLLERIQDWSDPAGYLRHLAGLPLGPNVACLLGHSTVRAHILGMDRSLDARIRPSAAEQRAMERLVEDALEAGYLGLSINTLPWDKMDGAAHRSLPTPSVHASWREYRGFMALLRRRQRVLQAVPNLATKLNILLFLAAATALGRPQLRTTLLALMDPKADRLAPRAAAWGARIVNALLGGDVRFQALPCPFDLWTDGLEVPVMEEIGSGTRALHEQDPERRSALLRDPAYRARFKRDWHQWLTGRAYHRNLDDTEILSCPDRAVVGLSFGDVARRRGQDPVDCFLDLQADHGDALRWYTVVANDRPAFLEWILTRPDILIGFSDAGAHLRNMAYYNYGLRLLWRVQVARQAGRPFLSPGQAIHRLTGEIADWIGVDAGHLAPGRRADVVVVDPRGLTAQVEQASEAPMPGFPGLQRVVRRNDRAVRQVYIRGRLAWDGDRTTEGFGENKGYGAVLYAR